MTKDEQRKGIARLTQEYLDSGGEIEQYRLARFCPPTQVDAQARRYTPWNHTLQWIGSGIWNWKTRWRLSEGCYSLSRRPSKDRDHVSHGRL